MQGSQYASNGKPDSAKKAICSAFVLTILGVISGIAVLAIIIVFQILANNEASNQQ